VLSVRGSVIRVKFIENPETSQFQSQFRSAVAHLTPLTVAA
jgi:hypothetical protein